MNSPDAKTPKEKVAVAATAPSSLPLHVTWEFTQPPLPATRWHAWEALGMGGEVAQDAPLEESFSWPRGTLAVLREAFALKLSRSTGFVGTEGLAAKDLSRLSHAATFFKRGVAFKEKVAVDTQKTPVLSGEYLIEFVAATEKEISFLEASAFCILDGNVAKYWPVVEGHFKKVFVTTLTEHTKTVESVAAILAQWQAAGKNKNWHIIGGGILADTAMFAASLVGAKATLIPTTLLAMADACVGGKTGVNFPPYGKNQIGSFAFPTSVKIWTGWLKSLPWRELRSGAVECLKHAFLSSDQILAEEIAAALSKRSQKSPNLEKLAAVMPAVVRVKAEVVAKDPVEAGERATLNLGHTLGHALEALSQEKTKGDTTIMHGEAVGIGIMFALALSVKVSGLDSGAAKQMYSYLKDAGCIMERTLLERSLACNSLAAPAVFEQLKSYMTGDKKNSGMSTHGDFILLTSSGCLTKIVRGAAGEWTLPVSWEVVKETWDEFTILL